MLSKKTLLKAMGAKPAPLSDEDVAHAAGLPSNHSYPNGRWAATITALQAENAALVEALDALEYTLPMAKGYAHTHQVGGNMDKIAGAEAAIEKCHNPRAAGAALLNRLDMAGKLCGILLELVAESNELKRELTKRAEAAERERDALKAEIALTRNMT